MQNLLVAQAPGMPGAFSPPLRVSDPDVHHGTLNSGFLGRRLRGKRSQHSRCMHNPHFCVSGKGPMRMILGQISKTSFNKTDIGTPKHPRPP